MRRRGGGGGAAALMRLRAQRERMAEKGEELSTLKLEQAQKIATDFKTSLLEFAKKHRHRINKDPLFRNAFHEMCLAIGVDPLQSTKGV